MRQSIPCMQIRGGSSKGLFFNARDLPQSLEERDRILLAAMAGVGPTDPRQIDGLGGADPLTSKVAIVSVSERADADIEYEFVQVVPGEGRTDRSQNCGNILAGVVPFVLETRMIKAQDPETVVRIFMVNSSSFCTVRVQSPGGNITYSGNTHIDGVPGTSAPVVCEYEGIAGSVCGSLLPTGEVLNTIDNIEVTCIDNGMPVVLLRAADLNRTGYESPEELNNDVALKEVLESIRLKAGKSMNLGDVSKKTIPKMILISSSGNALVNTRSFIPHRVHAAIGVLAAVTVAAGCLLPGSVAESVKSDLSGENTEMYTIEHPSGSVTVSLNMNMVQGDFVVKNAGIIRTARALSRSEILLPEVL